MRNYICIQYPAKKSKLLILETNLTYILILQLFNPCITPSESQLFQFTNFAI